MLRKVTTSLGSWLCPWGGGSILGKVVMSPGRWQCPGKVTISLEKVELSLGRWQHPQEGDSVPGKHQEPVPLFLLF